MAPRKSRQVRGETGAVFEVDSAMVDEPRALEGPFRASSGPLPASAIKPALPPRNWRKIFMLAGAVVALIAGAWIASASREARAAQSDVVEIRD